MGRALRTTLLLGMALTLAAAVGCAGPIDKENATLDFTARPSPTATARVAGTPPGEQSPASPEAPPQATLALTPSPSLAPTLTPTTVTSPTPTLTPSPTLSPTPASTKVEIADGFYYMKLDSALKKRITGISYPKDDKDISIKYDDLRYIGLKHYDFDGKVHDGELIVHKKLAEEVTNIFYALYKEKYPLTSVRLVDDFGEPGDDTLSMEANNTSAFNYRRVSGSKTLSRHSYGAAIDINPLYNPYITGKRIAPANGAPYADRTKDFPDKIDKDDLCYKLFHKYGWSWGGDFTDSKDYQHFSKTI